MHAWVRYFSKCLREKNQLEILIASYTSLRIINNMDFMFYVGEWNECKSNDSIYTLISANKNVSSSPLLK